MDLKEFITATLTQIAEGVAEAAPTISKLGGAVSPAFTPRADTGRSIGNTKDAARKPVYGVDFDVAVVASSADSVQAGAGIRIAGIGLGGQAGSSDKEETTSRVKFLVPLQLPTCAASQAAADAEETASERRQAELNHRLHNPGR